MELEICRATVEDADEVGYIHATSWRQTYTGIVPEKYLAQRTPEKRAESFRRFLRAEGVEHYLFRADGKGAGIAAIHRESGEEAQGELDAIYFLEKYWGTVCTAQAMDFLLTRLKTLGCRDVIIWVLKDNTRARKFYEKHGFTHDGTEEEIVLGKTLIKVRYAKRM